MYMNLTIPWYREPALSAMEKATRAPQKKLEGIFRKSVNPFPFGMLHIEIFPVSSSFSCTIKIMVCHHQRLDRLSLLLYPGQIRNYILMAPTTT